MTNAVKTGPRPWTWLALGAMLVKVAMIALTVVVPAGATNLFPAPRIEPVFFIIVGFLLSGIVFLYLRWWLGAVTVFAYAAYSLTGAPFSLGQYPVWLVAVMLTSAVALVGVIGALIVGEIRLFRSVKGNK